jgi:putative endopeptidase
VRFAIVCAVALLCGLTPLPPASGGRAGGGVDVSSLDRSVAPCDDFYRFANGSWLRENPVPADRATWGRFNELEQRNATTVRRILEEASRAGAHVGGVGRLVGDYYGSCMAEDEIEKAGLGQLAPELARIDRIKTPRDLQDEIARLHALGVNALFLVGPKQDARHSSEVILEVWQGGIGLPEGDYYF